VRAYASPTMAPGPNIELLFFGAPTLRDAATGVTERLSPQLKELLGLIVFEGTNLSISGDRAIAWLWDPEQETGLNARLYRLINQARAPFSALGGDASRLLAFKEKVLRLVDVRVDVQQFDIAFKQKEYAKALEVQERGPLLEGLPAGLRNDWKDRARVRFGTRICRCYYELAVALVQPATGPLPDPAEKVDEVIELFEQRLRAAITYDILSEQKEATERLDRLRTLRDVPGALGLASRVRVSRNFSKLPFERLMVQRMGSGLSLHVDPEHVDDIHAFRLLSRRDLLDYPTGDFYSIRRLQGINSSQQPSDGLIYAETSEVRLRFDQTETKAFDTASRKALAVESLLPSTISMFQHGFRILFPRPIAPGEDFDVVFAMKLPGELTFLSPEEEIMSVALVRYANGVGRLEFKVCLDFEPRRVSGEFFRSDGQFGTLQSPPSVELYTPGEWYERDLDIPWSSQPYVVSYAIDQPDAPLYSIRYRIS
jgi:hypothetical protein